MLDMHQQVGATEFAQQVDVLRHAVVRAEKNARSKGCSHLTREQRKALKRARDLWAVARDPGATEAERTLAAEQLQKVRGIVHLPDEAVAAIESTVRPALSAGAG